MPLPASASVIAPQLLKPQPPVPTPTVFRVVHAAHTPHQYSHHQGTRPHSAGRGTLGLLFLAACDSKFTSPRASDPVASDTPSSLPPNDPKGAGSRHPSGPASDLQARAQATSYLRLTRCDALQGLSAATPGPATHTVHSPSIALTPVCSLSPRDVLGQCSCCCCPLGHRRGCVLCSMGPVRGQLRWRR